MRALLGLSGSRVFLDTIARKKYQRLLSDTSFVEQQVRAYVGKATTEPELMDEAVARVGDSRTASLVERTAAAVRQALVPIEARI